MFRRTFKVCFRPMKNNFILLPENYYNLVSTYDNGCLSLQYSTICHYAIWAQYPGSIQDSEIGINARVAKEIGLKENDVVKVALIADVMMLKTVNVTPVSSKDWEIIELSSEKIQSTMLDQTKIINSTQILLIWINNSMQVSLTVDRIRPNTSFGRIDHNTELVIAPNIYKTSNNSTSNNYRTPSSSNESNIPLTKSQSISSFTPTNHPTLSRSSTLRNITTVKRSPSLTKTSRLEKLERLTRDLKKENSRSFEFRVMSAKWDSGAQFCDIFITKSNLPEFMDLSQCYVLQTISNQENEYYVNVKVIEDNDNFPNNIHRTIEVNENLLKYLKIKEMEKVNLKAKQPILNFIEKIELFANIKVNYKIIENAFKRFVVENTKMEPLLLNQNQIIRLDNVEDNLVITVRLIPDHFKYCWIDSQFLKDCKMYAADAVKKCDELLEIDEGRPKTVVSVKDLIIIEKFNKIVGKIVEMIKLDLCLDQRNSVLRQGNILISGNPNSGKSVIVEQILDALMKKPFCCYYDIYYCTRNKGRKVLIGVLAQEPKGGFNMKRLSQEIMKYALTINQNVTPITMALNGSASHPQACQALTSMLSRNTLNPADITVLWRNYSSTEPPPIDLIRNPQLLELLVDSLFKAGVKINPEHKSKYIYLLAYAASVVDTPGKKGLQRNLNKDELKPTIQAIEKVHAICNVNKGSTELIAELSTLYNCIRFPVVGVGVIRWIENTVTEPSYFKLTTDSCPTHLAILDEVATIHSSLHGQILSLLIRLFESKQDELEILVQLEMKKMLLDRMVNLLTRGCVVPVVKYIKQCCQKGDTDISLIRYFVTEVLETITHPYSPEFVQLFLPMVENEEITGSMRGEGDNDPVSEFIVHCKAHYTTV